MVRLGVHRALALLRGVARGRASLSDGEGKVGRGYGLRKKNIVGTLKTIKFKAEDWPP